MFQTFMSYWEKDGILYALGARSGAITRYDTVNGNSSIETMTEECHVRLAEKLESANIGTAGDSIYRYVTQNPDVKTKAGWHG
jgi:uncharacterized RmlC-like cupin family protein